MESYRVDAAARRPDRSGRETARQAQALCPGLPTLYVSAYSREFLVEQRLLAPDAAFLQKPFDPESLWAAEAVLGQPPA
jgi:hypothetical protein